MTIASHDRNADTCRRRSPETAIEDLGGLTAGGLGRWIPAMETAMVATASSTSLPASEARHDASDDTRGATEAAMIDRASPEKARADGSKSKIKSESKKGEGEEGPRCYAGGKNGAGVYHKLINLMPPHRDYIECFLGSGAVIRRKRPAPGDNVGIDVDAGIIAEHGAGAARGGYRVLHADAREWLRAHKWPAPGAWPPPLVYADPPYLASQRSRPSRAIYKCELAGTREHMELLELLTSLPAMVMISGYASGLYDAALKDWRRVEFQAMTRGGLKTEVVWMNYPEPTELHDYRYLGEDFHDRCRIARKIVRWRRKLAGLPPLERAAVIAGSLRDVLPPG